MSKPTFIFHTEHARQLGLEAAVVLAFVQEQVALGDSGNKALIAAEKQWLAWLPFLSPAGFWTATETLIDSGWLHRVEAERGELGLALGQSPDNSNGDTLSSAMEAPSSSTSGSATMLADTALARDDTLDDYDMPPPMPELSPLLTDRTTRVEQSAGASRRYSDEPLYAMVAQSRNGADSAGQTESTAPESTVRPGTSTTMNLQWQPGEDCLAMIRNRGIDTEFALAQRESFVLYYRDSGQRNMSWDTKFFNWVSRRWQYHLNDSQNDFRATASDRETSPRERRQKVRERLRNIGDVDW